MSNDINVNFSTVYSHTYNKIIIEFSQYTLRKDFFLFFNLTLHFTTTFTVIVLQICYIGIDVIIITRVS